MVKVTFRPQNITVDVPRGSTIYEASLKAGVDVGGICGGVGKCGKCRVRVIEGSVSEPTDTERSILGEEVKNGIRLACQTRILGDVVVYVASKGALKFAILGYEPKVELKPAVRVVKVRRSKVTLTTPHASTLESIEIPLGLDVTINLNVLRKLGQPLPDEVYLLLYSYGGVREVYDVLCNGRRVYGLAVDVGTSKVAVYIVDLVSGETVVAEAFENPQVVYGGDVVSRISYAMEYGVQELQKSIINSLNRFLKRICESRGINLNDIVDVVVVGNSVMHHIFLGVNPRKIGCSPYELAVRKPLTVRASELKLNVNPHARVYLPPLVRGFIGSDSLMGVLVLDLAFRKGTYLFIDIGTNTEVYIARNGRVIAASTASGPVFEGGHIKCGMRAGDGAIDHVRIDSETLEPEISIIGGTSAKGICGSGVIDVVAEMLKTGIIDYTGRFRVTDHPRIRRGSDGYEYIIVRKGEFGAERDIVLTLKDIREIQKAKAAVQAAFRILSGKLGITRRDIDRVYIAGSFGFYLNPESAITIGLLPEVPLDKITLVGNTAGSGARILLKNIDWRVKVEKLYERVEYVELAAERVFHKVFIDSIYFPSGNVSEYPETVKKIKYPKTA